MFLSVVKGDYEERKREIEEKKEAKLKAAEMRRMLQFEAVEAEYQAKLDANFVTSVNEPSLQNVFRKRRTVIPVDQYLKRTEVIEEDIKIDYQNWIDEDLARINSPSSAWSIHYI